MPVNEFKSNEVISNFKFKRVGFDDDGNMYYRLSLRKYLKYNKDVVEIVDTVPVEFVKVKEITKQVMPKLQQELEGTLYDFSIKYFRAQTEEEALIIIVWLLSCFFVTTTDRPLLILEGDYSGVLASMIRKIILPINYEEPLVINNATNVNSKTIYMLTNYCSRRVMSDENVLRKAIYVKLKNLDDIDVEELLVTFVKDLPTLLAHIFYTVKNCSSLMFESQNKEVKRYSFLEIGELYLLIKKLEFTSTAIEFRGDFTELYELCKYNGVELLNDSKLTVEV